MQALIAQAFQAAAVERLTLRVYRDNAAAVALYRSLGFEPVDAASTPTLLFMQRARR
ncbi:MULTISPECIES: GNAT family N-acetyltransferase [Stenotrophomonas]|uniref:GNAT family N-acetyltransferase n=1 Tax=Stenotrophomonas TaxID=40323 RepID=UPI002AA58F47